MLSFYEYSQLKLLASLPLTIDLAIGVLKPGYIKASDLSVWAKSTLATTLEVSMLHKRTSSYCVDGIVVEINVWKELARELDSAKLGRN